MRINKSEPVPIPQATPGAPVQAPARDPVSALDASASAVQLALRAPAVAAESSAAHQQRPRAVLCADPGSAAAGNTERGLLLNAVGASVATGLSLVHNAAAALVGGRRPDGVIDPKLSAAEAGAYLSAARMAMDVYKDEGAPAGSARVGKDELAGLGLDPAAFDDKRSGTFAALYRDEASGAYSLAFRGSELSNLQKFSTDWLQSNVGQALGTAPPSYRHAADLTCAVSQALGGEVKLVGHSLGGGLANYAAVKNNLDFTIFNAAGLSKPVEHSLAKELAAYKGEGIVINDKFDPLTNLGGQEIDETFGGQHLGYSKLMFIDNPEAEPQPAHLGVVGRIDAHFIDTSITGYLQSQIDADATV